MRKLPEEPGWQETPSPFDHSAALYDAEFENSPATRRLRRITTGAFLQLFPAGSHLLELNCGTGTDAVKLARHGMKIMATDASAAMLEEARKKIAAECLSDSITLELLPFREIARLKGQKFDGVYSNMGGLNCVPDVRSVALELAGLVSTGAYVAACMLSDVSLWETTAFLLRGNLGNAFRRKTPSGVVARIHKSSIPVYYHSPASVADQFAPHFRKVSVIGLNIFSPPPSSQRAYKILGKGRIALERLDDLVSGLFPFNNLGDHFLIVLERTDV